MSAYLIVDITVHDPERYQDYVRQVPVLINKHQGSYRVRGGEVEVKEGGWHPQRLIVLEFPDREHDQPLRMPYAMPLPQPTRSWLMGTGRTDHGGMCC